MEGVGGEGSSPAHRTSAYHALRASSQSEMSRRQHYSLSTDFQHHSEPRLAAHHPLIRLFCLLERIDLIHGSNASQRAELEGVFGIHAGSRRPPGNCTATEEQREW